MEQYELLLLQLHFNVYSNEPQHLLGIPWAAGPHPDTKMISDRLHLFREVQEGARIAAK